jgi:ankyrin repeat protein
MRQQGPDTQRESGINDAATEKPRQRLSAIFQETKMPCIQNVLLQNTLLIAMLSLAPAVAAHPAAASVRLAETQDAVAPPEPRDVDRLGQEQLKEIFFDAARKGRDDLLDGLIDSGMKPDERDPHGFTALILAAYNGQAKTVDLLIAKGANPCATDARGNNSLMGVAFKGESGIAARLIAAHCDVNARNDAGQTALMMASIFGQMEVVKLLLEKGADAEIQDKAGNTAASLAQQQANPQMVTLLSRAGKGL